MKYLKLIAHDADDLKIVASALQDAIVRVGDIAFMATQRSLSLRVFRFRHERLKAERVEAGLRIDNILSLQSQGIDRSNPDAFIVLLDAEFVIDDAPSGVLTLTFAGGGAMRVKVEALDVILADGGQSRRTRLRPDHDLL